METGGTRVEYAERNGRRCAGGVLVRVIMFLFDGIRDSVTVCVEN